MARLITSLQSLWRVVAGAYQPEKYYMRGPGPASRAKKSSLNLHGKGGSFPRIVDTSDTAKVAPDAKLTMS